MNSVFGDTSFFIALCNAHDAAHERAKAVFDSELGRRLITTEWILGELGNTFSSGIGRRKFEGFLAVLQNNSNVEILPATSEIFARGCALYFSRPDKEWSLTDCISFVVMQDRELTDAPTGDHHFEQAGFRALLRG